MLNKADVFQNNHDQTPCSGACILWDWYIEYPDAIRNHTQNTASASSHPIQHPTAGTSTHMTSVGLVMAGCCQINYILTNIGRRNSIWILNPLILKYIDMNTVYLFYQSFCILKLKVALISCSWSKVPSKTGENNGLIRPPAESVPGLDNGGLPDKLTRWDWGRSSTSSGFPVWERVGWGNWADGLFCLCRTCAPVLGRPYSARRMRPSGFYTLSDITWSVIYNAIPEIHPAGSVSMEWFLAINFQFAHKVRWVSLKHCVYN